MAYRGRSERPFTELCTAIIRYKERPKQYACPQALTLGRHLGDDRMLVEGGLLDQPATLWFTAQYARYISDFYDRVTAQGFKVESLRRDEFALHKQILTIQSDL